MPHSLSFLSSRLVIRSDRLTRLVVVSCKNLMNEPCVNISCSPSFLTRPTYQISLLWLSSLPFLWLWEPIFLTICKYWWQIFLLWSKNTLLIFSHSFQVCLQLHVLIQHKIAKSYMTSFEKMSWFEYWKHVFLKVIRVSCKLLYQHCMLVRYVEIVFWMQKIQRNSSNGQFHCFHYVR